MPAFSLSCTGPLRQQAVVKYNTWVLEYDYDDAKEEWCTFTFPDNMLQRQSKEAERRNYRRGSAEYFSVGDSVCKDGER
ncbi:hypothetical protein MTO96_044057 [Rhipicephalus appendiculatus]